MTATMSRPTRLRDLALHREHDRDAGEHEAANRNSASTSSFESVLKLMDWE